MPTAAAKRASSALASAELDAVAGDDHRALGAQQQVEAALDVVLARRDPGRHAAAPRARIGDRRVGLLDEHVERHVEVDRARAGP